MPTASRCIVSSIAPGWLPSRPVMAATRLARLTYQVDRGRNGQPAYEYWLGYDWASQRVVSETVTQRQGADTITSTTTTDYGSGATFALGGAASTTTDTSKNGTPQAQTFTTNAYDWYDGARIAATTTSGATTASTGYGYASSGPLRTVSIGDGRPRAVTFANDVNGQAIARDEADANPAGGDPHEIWYRFGGREIGHIGNWAAPLDYAGSVTQRTQGSRAGALTGDVS